MGINMAKSVVMDMETENQDSQQEKHMASLFIAS